MCVCVCVQRIADLTVSPAKSNSFVIVSLSDFASAGFVGGVLTAALLLPVTELDELWVSKQTTAHFCIRTNTRKINENGTCGSIPPF